MSNVNIIFNRFIGGECSPLLGGRIDFGKYQAGAKRLENFIPLIQGPLKKRPGSRFVAETKYSHLKSWLIKFEFSANISYVIEVGHLYFRFYTGGGILLDDNDDDETSSETETPSEIETPSETKTPSKIETLYEIETPYEIDDLEDTNGILALKYAQAGDVIYLVHPNYFPRKLSRHGHTDWVLEEMPGWPGVDRSETVKDEKKTPPDENISPEEGEDEKKLKRANPMAVTFFRERLCFGAKQTLWLSAAGAFEDFDSPGSDPATDDPIEINIYSEETNNIEWLCPGRGLLVGTSGGEFMVDEVSLISPLGPDNIKITPHTGYGSLPVKPVRIGGAILFIQKAGRKVRELMYDFTSDNYGASDLTIAAEHISKSGLLAMAWQQEPDHVLWLVRKDGVLLGLTYARDQEMIAWHRHLLGGHGKVESVVSIPVEKAGWDALWLIVKREINGKIKRWVEFITPGYQDNDDKSHLQSTYLDASLNYEGEPAQDFFGLEHLEGLEVSIVANGAVHPPVTVKNASIKLEYSSSVVQVGLAYTSIIETMNLDFNNNSGTIQGRLKRVLGIVLRLWCSLGGAIGPDENYLERLMWRKGNDPMDQAQVLFSGDTDLIHWSGDYNTHGRILIYHAEPLPFTLLSLMPKIYLGGER